MNYTQNERIKQVGEKKLIVGIDVGVTIHTLIAPSQHQKTGISRSFSFRW